MSNTIKSTVADALMDFALYIYAQEYDGNEADLISVHEKALEFARNMFKGYCKINGIEYVEQE